MAAVLLPCMRLSAATRRVESPEGPPEWGAPWGAPTGAPVGGSSSAVVSLNTFGSVLLQTGGGGPLCLCSLSCSGAAADGGNKLLQLLSPSCLLSLSAAAVAAAVAAACLSLSPLSAAVSLSLLFLFCSARGLLSVSGGGSSGKGAPLLDCKPPEEGALRGAPWGPPWGASWGALSVLRAANVSRGTPEVMREAPVELYVQQGSSGAAAAAAAAVAAAVAAAAAAAAASGLNGSVDLASLQQRCPTA